VEGLGAHWPIAPGIAAEGQAVSYGVRPTDLRLAAQGIPARVVIVEPTGAETELLVEVGGQQMVVVLHGRTQAQPGDAVHLELDAAKAHVFDAASGLRLG
jgi:multiple sugar transport system ATP-binding protein